LSELREREVDFDDVRRILDKGDIIERYPDDSPYGSKLSLGWVGGRPVHIVSADVSVDEVIVVTVYVPTPESWSSDFRSRIP
jgi:hypothetical protein